MKDILVVNECESGFFLQWSLDDGDDLGSVIGEEYKLTLKEEPDRLKSEADWEHYTATRIALRSGPEILDSCFVWDSRKKVSTVLKAIKAEFKGSKKAPKWAAEALALGWKPPS